MIRLFSAFFFLTIFFQFAAVSQETTKIQYSGNSLRFNKEIGQGVQRIIGNVVMNHDSAFLFCDSAYMNEAENKVTAYGNCRIKLSDTLNLYSDSLHYDGNTKIARAHSNVRLVDNQTILTTDTLVYDRKTQIAQYDYWGKTVNAKNVLVSHHGYYYTDKKEFFFKDKVIMINPDYSMFSDTLKYNTVTEIAYFYGPSHIISKNKEDSIYCENGWYNTRNDIARFHDRAKIYHESSYLTGDSLYYERKMGYGQVFRHAMLIDTIQNILLLGNYGEMWRSKGFAYMTDSAVSIMVDKKDSLFIHSDTVRSTFDTAQNIKNLFFYNKVKFFRGDLQGMSDSLVYHAADSVLLMYKEPVIWSGKNQLTSDSIQMSFRNGHADSLKLYNSAFIILKDDSVRFNQIKGRNVLAKFRDNDIYKVLVQGNAETIYYVREEDKNLIGINTAVSSDMLIFLEKNEIKSITYITNPDAHLYPEKMLPIQERKLKNFKWLEERRPTKKSDIFIW
ncbi:MAG: hypothetical protein M0P47_00480 [Bacteroidales bacterium]|nr:hypothetical protein [Bacteroidales bacterium]